MREVKRPDGEEKREINNAVNSGRYVLPVTPKCSTRTPIGPIMEDFAMRTTLSKPYIQFRIIIKKVVGQLIINQSVFTKAGR